MSKPVIAFFNNKGGVGKTSVVYHLAWMLADRGLSVIAADLDPQCNLTAAFLDDDRLEELMADTKAKTLLGAIGPLTRRIGDIAEAHVEPIDDRLGLILGDMALSSFEDLLSENWPKCLNRDEGSFRVISAFWRILQSSANRQNADVVLVDLGPNLGAINRAVLIATNHVAIPLGPDLFSLQGLQNLGPALHTWREEWKERLGKRPGGDLDLPPGDIEPLGYILLRHTIRLDRPVKAYDRWIARIPSTYAKSVLRQDLTDGLTVDQDPHCIAKLRDYRGLMPLAQEARKPMFHLKAADGALGAHSHAVAEVYKDFRTVAQRIAAHIGVDLA